MVKPVLCFCAWKLATMGFGRLFEKLGMGTYNFRIPTTLPILIGASQE